MTHLRPVLRHLLRIAPVALVLAAVAVVVPSGASGADMSEVREEAVVWAEDQVGHREDGTTNCSTRIRRWQRDMGLDVPPCRPWCGAFVHQAFKRAGVKLSARLIDPHRSYHDAVKRRRGLERIKKSSVREGDLLFFKFRDGVKASHLAIVRGKPKNGKARTVEGNVSHRAVLRTRGLKYAVLAARVVGD